MRLRFNLKEKHAKHKFFLHFIILLFIDWSKEIYTQMNLEPTSAVKLFINSSFKWHLIITFKKFQFEENSKSRLRRELEKVHFTPYNKHKLIQSGDVPMGFKTVFDEA